VAWPGWLWPAEGEKGAGLWALKQRCGARAGRGTEKERKRRKEKKRRKEIGKMRKGEKEKKERRGGRKDKSVIKF
jgi:hypothetical protein